MPPGDMWCLHGNQTLTLGSALSATDHLLGPLDGTIAGNVGVLSAMTALLTVSQSLANSLSTPQGQKES